MSFFSLLFRGYKDIRKMGKGILPLALLQNLLLAIRPLVNVWFPARILDALMKQKQWETHFFYVCAAVILNAAIFMSIRWLERVYSKSRDLLWTFEEMSISKKLMAMEYQHLDSHEFSKKVSRHVDDVKTSSSIFITLLSAASKLFSALIGLVLSFILIFPFIKVLFLQSGLGFWDSIWLPLLIIMCVIAFLLLFLPLNWIAGKKTSAFRNRFLDINRIFGYYTNMITDYNTGKEIRLFKEQDFILHHATSKMLDEGMKLEERIGRIHAITSGAATVVMSIISFGLYILIGLKGLVGLIGLGDIVCAVGGFIQIVKCVGDSISVFGEFSCFQTRIQLYYDILDEEVSKENRGDLPLTALQKIECKNLSFRYENMDVPAVKNVSLTIEQGERIAFVGENGSGKTTFIKLLCRLYQPKNGQVYINGIDACAYNMESYQSQFSVVFQDYQIFSLPLGENIAASSSIDMDRVLACLEKAGFSHRLKSMEHGLETYLYRDCDEEGVEISGGEAQKLALARALYRDTSIMILDEPTAALDPIAEFELYTKFNDLIGNKTAIYISHRLSSCRFCDKIAVFDHGELTQFGSHDNLVRDKSGKYFELWNAQAKYYV
jgi:ATP-binding cassette subfamily B protein